MLSNIFHKLIKIIFSKKFLASLLIVIFVASALIYLNKNDTNQTDFSKSNLPYKEKVGEGAWELKNYDPIRQTFATEKANTALVENKNAIKSSITNPSDTEIYRWSVTLPNKTVFAFGQQLKDGIFPSVKVTNKDGLFVKYYPQGFSGFVNPKVKGNIIEWEIVKGIKARYTMMQDRIKADYIVSSKQAIENGKLDFTVEYSKDKDKALTPELMPQGDISWLNNEAEIFNFPAPVIKDSKDKPLSGEYELIKSTEKTIVSILLLEKELNFASFPVTIDPVIIDSLASSEGTAYANGRKILRDGWGNLIVLLNTGADAANIWYKNYSSVSWTNSNADLDGASDTFAFEIAVDLNSSGNLEVAFYFSTGISGALNYARLNVTRNGSNNITAIAHASGSPITLDATNFARRPSLVVANKGGGAGVEKIAVAYGMNSTGAGRGEIRFLQCDVADDCTSAANWKNASEEKNGSGTCSDTATSGNAGLPNSATCKGTADKIFDVLTNTNHHAVITQVPGKDKRTPASAKKFDGTSYTNLTNALDNNTGTTADLTPLDLIDDYFYIGDSKPFSNIVIDLTTPSFTAEAYLGNQEYCSGVDGSNNCTTWTLVSNVLDRTQNSSGSLATDGSILFDEPSNWVSSTVNGDNRYWLRQTAVTTEFGSAVTVAEFYVTDRNSRALLVVGGVDSTDDLGTSYIPWDFINNNKWENNIASPTLNWISSTTSIDTLGGNWTTFTNYPLTAAVDYINNSVFVSYVEDQASDVLHVKKAFSNKDLSIAANWIDTGFPTVTEGTDIVVSITSDGSDIYLFYNLNPGTNSLVFRKCIPSGGGDGNICDNAADWGSEKTLVSGTDLSHPQAVATKVLGDTIAIDAIYTMPTALDVVYERHYVDLSDKTVVVATSGDDAYQAYDCGDTGGFQVINSTTLDLGRIFDTGCPSGYSEQHIGMRFPNVTVEQGAVIASAYVDIRVSARSGASPLNFTIYGEDANSSAAFVAVTSPCDTTCITERTRTIISSGYVIDLKTNTYRFDVTDIVQEIVCRGAANSQPCVGNFNGSGAWASGNALAILLISSEGGSTNNYARFIAQDDTVATTLDPTLQINIATTGNKYSMGYQALPTGSGSHSDLDHPLSSAEVSSVATNDTNFASISATTNFASQSAVPAFLFKVNNLNNDNTTNIDAQAIVKSTVPTTSKTVYMQVYRGGSTNDWVTMASDTTALANTDITLDPAAITTNLSEYYFNETPGIGTLGAACTTGTTNCWTYWRIYQDAPGTNLEEVLSVDYFNLPLGSTPTPTPTLTSSKIRGGLNIRGGSKIR